MPQTKVNVREVKLEFYRSTEKIHILSCWIGLLLNLVWFISDYFIIRESLVPFFFFRLTVSGLSAIILLFRSQLRINMYHCMFVLVAGISIQNAYMWSVMDVQHIQLHAFAYMVLFIGVGMLVLWEMKLSILLVIITLISNAVFYLAYSKLSFEDFMVHGGLITFSTVIFCIFLIRSRYRLTYNEIKIRLELELSKLEIQSQKDTLEVKNREITDSISYAKSIQNSLIPSEEKFKAALKECFVFFRPKDIVSGDFYWIYEKGDLVYYVTADCTGHGVPGGFMTMLGLSFLEQIIVNQNVSDPAEVLNRMKEKLIKTLNQYGEVGENKDGMDITVCKLNTKTKELVYSAANNNLYLVRDSEVVPGTKELIVHKADRQPCGYYVLNKPFTSSVIQLKSGDCLYTFTDGYADQFGGPKGKKFRYKQFEQMLLNNSHLEMKEQRNILSKTMDDWMGKLEQADDILVIGVRV